jgi:hypothetical protein
MQTRLRDLQQRAGFCRAVLPWQVADPRQNLSACHARESLPFGGAHGPGRCRGGPLQPAPALGTPSIFHDTARRGQSVRRKIRNYGRNA